MNKLNVTELICGDTSHDGHCKEDNCVVISNLSTDKLKEAYAAGVKICSVDITTFFGEYEDSSIEYSVLSKLRSHGVDLDPEWDWSEEVADDPEAKYDECDTEMLFQIWLGIAKLGDPSLEFTCLQYRDRIDVGGYGLYYG